MTDTTFTIEAGSIVLTTDDPTAAALVATIKGAVNGAGKYGAYVAAHGVTRENVKEHARALAVLAYPNDKPVQTVKDENGTKTRTRFGNAVQAAGAGLRAHLESKPRKERDLLAELVKAAERAADNGHTPEDIMAALKAVLDI